MRIILTGATSFVGRAAYQCLKEHGHEIILFRHSFDEESEKLPKEADVWLHFAWAGVGSVGRSDPSIQQYNVDMTLAAAKKAEELSCVRFVFAGSQAEYGHAQDGSLKKEDGPTAPVSEYGKAKLRVCEQASAMLSEKGKTAYVHMRLFSAYGPGDHAGSLIDTLVRGFGAGESVNLGPCTQNWNYLYIDDVAEGIALLCEKAPAGIYNLAGEENKKLCEYVTEVNHILGDKGNAAFGQRADNAEGPADLSADISKIQTLGFHTKYSFREGIIKTANSIL